MLKALLFIESLWILILFRLHSASRTETKSVMWLNNKYWRRIIMGIWYTQRPVGAAKVKGTIT